jgi:hypothetical protein
MKNSILIIGFVTGTMTLFAQEKKPISVSGTIGVSYEHYGLDRNPDSWMGFSPRKPWNQLRFNLAPEIKFPKWSLPLNFNFSTTPTNFAGPYTGIKKQSFSQYVTNPMNNFGLNPKYKWAELQLGTQYIRYSELSTGDIGVFGAGFDLRPSSYRIKFFTGISQQSVNFFTGPPATTGAYRRNNWMFSVGKEVEGKYEVSLNFVKGKDGINSVDTVPPNIKPQEAFTTSLFCKVKIDEHWYASAEGAHSIYTKDLSLPKDTTKPSFKPFIEARTSTMRDLAGQASFGRKSQNFDIGAKIKFIGAGFQTPGYPYMQPDRLDYTLNTRIIAWKNKMNITASGGQRINNISNTTLKAKQFIGNLNWFTQFDEHWNVNLSFNNFGFQTPSGINPYGIKNVSNDIGINPTYTLTKENIMHFFSLSYNWSQYDERDVFSGNITSNNTHTALLTWVPTFLKKQVIPDFSLLFFLNKLPGFKTTLITFTGGVSLPLNDNKINFRAQAQYHYTKNNSFKNNNNFIGSANMDWKLTKQLTWSVFLGSNYFKYGNEVIPDGARYLETNCRTGFQYRFDK